MVLGLVERDLLLDVLDVVAREDAPRVFDVAGRLVESGQDLKHVCRELARLVRDLMVLQVDPQRAADPEFAVEGDARRLRCARRRVLARGSAARLRSGREARSRHALRDAAAVSPRDGAPALGPSAQAACRSRS